eukprot:10448713-Lingulodinium_polyedra.AAC.1
MGCSMLGTAAVTVSSPREAFCCASSCCSSWRSPAMWRSWASTASTASIRAVSAAALVVRSLSSRPPARPNAAT